MPDITLSVPIGQVPRVKAALLWLFPIPQIPDPEWIDPGDGSTAPMVDAFSENDWMKESIRRWIISQVKRYERWEAANDARDGVATDDTLIS